MKKLLMSLSLAILANSTCFAESYEKNGLPCLAELCIGDGLAELKNIQWIPRQDITKLSRDKDVIRYLFPDVSNEYRGKFSPKTMVYLGRGFFDAEALPLLSGVTVKCFNEGDLPLVLKGTYKSKSGFDTEVKIILKPKVRGAEDRQWTVVSIKRYMAFIHMSSNDVNEMERQVAERYKRFFVPNGDDRPLRHRGYDFRENGFVAFDKSNTILSLSEWNPDGWTFTTPELPSPQCVKKINLD